MDKPTDYPIGIDQSELYLDFTLVDMTYAALKDRVDAKQPITDEMIRIAVTKLETAYVSTDAKAMQKQQLKSTLNKLRDRFRLN